jgi:hypothetical protein
MKHLRRCAQGARPGGRAIDAQLKKLGADVSRLKDLTMRLTGRLQPLLSGIAPDDMPKNRIAGHAARRQPFLANCSSRWRDSGIRSEDVCVRFASPPGRLKS